MLMKLLVVFIIIVLFFAWFMLGQFVYDEVINNSKKHYYKTFICVLWPLAILICIGMNVIEFISDVTYKIRNREEESND